MALKDLKDVKNWQRSYKLEIKGGSADCEEDISHQNYKKNLSVWKKIKRGKISSLLSLNLKYYEDYSEEMKFY